MVPEINELEFWFVWKFTILKQGTDIGNESYVDLVLRVSPTGSFGDCAYQSRFRKTEKIIGQSTQKPSSS